MGFLRIYLALCVVAAHAGRSLFPWPMHSSVEAVQIFFLISGFYMSLIASKYKSALEFYTSRFLRIFVPYYVILGLVLIACVASGVFAGNWLDLTPYLTYSAAKNGLPGVAFAALTNLTLFFQDWVMFLKDDPGQSLSLTAHFVDNASPLYLYLIIRQAWSIGTELTFYLFVPLLSKLRARWLFLIALASLAARIYTYQTFGLTKDPFNYRFFPFELLLFVAGMLSQRVYARTLARWPLLKLKSLPQYLLLVAALILFTYLTQQVPDLLRRPLGRPYALLASYAVWAAVVPLLFHLTGDLPADRFLGELSYPVYLIHFSTLEVVNLVLVRYSLPDPWLGPIGAPLSLLLAALLYLFLFKPFEGHRQEWARNLTARWARPRKEPVRDSVPTGP